MILYRLHSVIDNWPHRRHRYNQVHVTWFKTQNDLPVAALFDGTPDAYAESQAEECFTAEQADALTAYLKGEHDTEVIREPVALPLPIGHWMGVGAIAVGGGDDFYTLDQEDAYSLPFKVWGYYCIEGAESYFVMDGGALAHVNIPGPGAAPDLPAVNADGLPF